jgi:signal transduction histidine kinase
LAQGYYRGTMQHATHVIETPELPRLAERLRPLIERVARVPASVHAKLRTGFLVGALLLLAMAGLSVTVLNHMSERVEELNQAQQRVDLLRQMQYLVTAQSHYRAMALLTHDESNLVSIADAKSQFLADLDQVERDSPPSERGLLGRVRSANERFAASSQRVLELERQGADAEAMQLHLGEEHPISHEIEGAMQGLLQAAMQEATQARAVRDSDQRLLTWLVVGFCLASLATALLLGFVLSWSFLLPLRTIRYGLGRLAGGRFEQPVHVTNRDEFGDLGRDLDATRLELAQLYGTLEDLNAQLRGTNTQLLSQLQAQVVELARSRSLIAEAEERLRREIAEVLHSRVQNRLLLVWYRLEECQELVQRDPAAAERAIGELRQLVDQIREQDVRELSHRLHPSIIRAGLLPALETLVEDVPRPPVHLQADPSVEDLDNPTHAGLPESIRLTAYRVVEEALANVVRHANASRVDVEVGVADARLRVDVRDDGVGFDTRTHRPGLGLGAIAARVERVGGRWSIESSEGSGTRLSVWLPSSVDQVQNGFDAQAALGQEGGAKLAGRPAVGPVV